MKTRIALLLIVLSAGSVYAQDFGIKYVYSFTNRLVTEFHSHAGAGQPYHAGSLRPYAEDRLDGALMELRSKDKCTFDSVLRKYGLVFDTSEMGKDAERCAPTIFEP